MNLTTMRYCALYRKDWNSGSWLGYNNKGESLELALEHITKYAEAYGTMNTALVMIIPAKITISTEVEKWVMSLLSSQGGATNGDVQPEGNKVVQGRTTEDTGQQETGENQTD